MVVMVVGGMLVVLWVIYLYIYLKGDFSLRVYYIVIFNDVFPFFLLIAVLGPSLEPSHTVVPLFSPLDHYRSLRQHQSVAPFSVVLLAENQVKPIVDGKKLIPNAITANRCALFI